VSSVLASLATGPDVGPAAESCHPIRGGALREAAATNRRVGPLASEGHAGMGAETWSGNARRIRPGADSGAPPLAERISAVGRGATASDG